eukprot:Rmarinus@m.6082
MNARGHEVHCILLEKNLCCFQFHQDAYFYLISAQDENELIMASVLQCLMESLLKLLHEQVDKRNLIENMDTVLLAIDELVDDGLILCFNSGAHAQRVAVKSSDPSVPLAEQTLSEALAGIRKQVTQSLLK